LTAHGFRAIIRHPLDRHFRRRFMISHSRRSVFAIASLALIATLSLTARHANAQAAPADGRVVSGISCDAQEGQRIHIHQHLLILDHGKPVAIPATVGQPAGRRCIYWVHTHTPDGIIHIEAPQNRSFTLGDFFDIWGQPLSRAQAATAREPKGKTLKVWVNGKPFTGDPRKIALVAHVDIVIEAGPPFPKPPAFTNWGPL
jgi:hypothetical protein